MSGKLGCGQAWKWLAGPGSIAACQMVLADLSWVGGVLKQLAVKGWARKAGLWLVGKVTGYVWLA